MNVRHFLAVVLLTAAALAQQSPPKKPDPEPKKLDPQRVNPWLERAKLVTAEIEDDSWHLSWDQRAVLYARLAEPWAKSDPKRSHDLLNESVDMVTYIPRNESDEHRRQRTDAARVVYDIAAPLAPQLADKVMASLTEGLDVSTVRSMKNIGQRMKAGISLANVAEKIMHDDPQRTAELVRQMIQLGDGNDLQRIIPFLRADHAALADQLIMEAVASARTDYDSNLLFGLAQVLSPRNPRPDPYNAPYSQEIQDAVLQVVAEAMLRVPQSADDQKQTCGNALTVAQLLPRYPPQQMGALQAAISSCNPGTNVEKEIKATISDLKTSDDYSKAAATETDVATRAKYKMRAADLVEHDKDTIRALDIMNSLTPEERDAVPGWSVRVGYLAAQGIQERYTQHDTANFQALIDRVPDDQRAMVLLTAGQAAISQGDTAFGSIYIVAARRALEKTDPYAPTVFSMLLGAYARALPSELSQVFPFYVAGLNRFKSKDPKTGKPVLNLPWTQLRPLGVPKQVLELDESFVRGCINTLDEAAARESLRLGVLKGALNLYADSQKPPSPEKPNPEVKKTAADAKEPPATTQTKTQR